MKNQILAEQLVAQLNDTLRVLDFRTGVASSEAFHA